MSKGLQHDHFRFITVGFIIVVSALVVVAVWDLASRHTERRLEADARSHQIAIYAQEQIERSCSRLSGSEALLCVTKAIKSSDNVRRSELSLVAQQEVADWAFWMVVISILTVLVTGAGVYYVALTLVETRRATAAAIDAIDVNRESAQSQLRAYVSVERASIVKFNPDEPVEVRLHIKNTGQTPAFKMNQLVLLKADSYPSNFEFYIPADIGEDVQSELGSGLVVTTFIDTGTPLTANQLDSVQSGSAAVWVWGRIDYEDIFGRKFYTEFRFIFGGHLGVRPNGAMGTDRLGNVAT